MAKSYTVKFSINEIEHTVNLLDVHLIKITQFLGIEDPQLTALQQKLTAYGVSPALPDLCLVAGLDDLKAMFESFIPSLIEIVQALPQDQKDNMPDDVKKLIGIGAPPTPEYVAPPTKTRAKKQ